MKRTTHRAGTTKVYAVRDKEGRFKDIQRYSRAHARDVKQPSGDEELKLLRSMARALLDFMAKLGVPPHYDYEFSAAKWKKKYAKSEKIKAGGTD